MKTEHTLKTVSYAGSHGNRSNPRNVVAYRVYGRHIVFTGMFNGTNGARGSTVNFAEEIVEAILEQEKLQAHCVVFYDLQTMRGYGNNADFTHGSYNFNRLRLQWKQGRQKPSHVSWEEGFCHKDVLHDFAEFIWGDKAPSTPRHLAVAYGALKPLTKPIPKSRFFCRTK